MTIEALYTVNGWWPVKAKYLLSDLRTRDPLAAEKVIQLLERSAPLELRVESLKIFAQETLEPVGGFIGEWETQRQEMPCCK